MNTTQKSEPEFTGCSVVSPTLIYAWPGRADFALIPLEETVHDWAPCRTTTLIKNDGQQWEHRIRSKWLKADNDIKVIFQVFEERPADPARNSDTASEVPA